MTTRVMTSPAWSASWLPVGVLLVAMTSIQGGASLAKQLFPHVGASGASALRLAFGALILLVVMRPWRARLSAGAWRSVLAYGLSLGGMNLLFYQALERIPLGVAVALEFSGPLVVALCASRRLLDLVWVALATTGLLLLLPLGPVAAGIDPMGAVFALAAGVCWALYILFGQKAGAAHGMQTTALGVLIAAFLVVPFGVAQAGTALLAPSLLPLAIAVAVLTMALPYSLEMVALTRLPTRTFGTLMSIEPAFAALSGVLFLHEMLTPLQWGALGAIMLASVGTTVTNAEPKPVPATE